jgi:hypothetical protein
MVERELPQFCSKCAWVRAGLGKWLRLVETGRMTSDEFDYNTTLSLLRMCNACTESYLDWLPDGPALRLDGYLRALRESNGLTPFVMPSVVDFHNQAEIQTTSQTIEPQVIRLCTQVSDRASRIR